MSRKFVAYRQCEPSQWWRSPLKHTCPSPHDEISSPIAHASSAETTVTSRRSTATCGFGGGCTPKCVHDVPSQWQVSLPPAAQMSFAENASTLLRPDPHWLRTSVHF